MSNPVLKRFLLLIAVASSLFLGACATGIKHSAMQEQLVNIPDGKARVYFYRDSSVIGFAIQPNISLNVVVVGESKPGGFFYLDIPPGGYEATAKTEATARINFELREAEVLYIRSYISFGFVIGRPHFTQVSKQEAEQVLASLSHTGNNTASLYIPEPRPPENGDRRSIGSERAFPNTGKPVTLDDLDGLLLKK